MIYAAWGFLALALLVAVCAWLFARGGSDECDCEIYVDTDKSVRTAAPTDISFGRYK